MQLKSFVSLLLLPAALALPELHTPFNSSSRWILDSKNERFKMRCINWPGHLEANIPEGLQHQSADYIASWIAKQGFNCVRLTYSIDMILNPSLSVSDSFNNAASAAGVSGDDMRALYNQVNDKNPNIAKGTILGAFDGVIKALGAHNVGVVLDNHVSKAGWCCNPVDGNAWFDQGSGYVSFASKYFNTDNWIKGLGALATHVHDAGLKNVIGMSLRNELRPFITQDFMDNDWYKFMQWGADTVHAANPDLLVILGGTWSATNFAFMRFRPIDTSVAWRSKAVWEFHLYTFSFPLASNQDCTALNNWAGGMAGYLLTQNKDYTGPLFLSEFGVGQTGGPNDGLTDGDNNYMNCLTKYMESNDAEWAVWGVQGDYYVREGKVSYEEGWGLMDKNWNDWRNPKFADRLSGMLKVTQGP